MYLRILEYVMAKVEFILILAERVLMMSEELFDKSNDNRIKQNSELNDCDFILLQDDFDNYEIRYNDEVFHFLWEVAPILNKQQAIIQSLKEEINKLNEELYSCEKFRYQVFQRLSELNGD